jgi:hypothetical protein
MQRRLIDSVSANFFASDDNESDELNLLHPGHQAIGTGAKEIYEAFPASGGLCVTGFLFSAERQARHEDS